MKIKCTLTIVDPRLRNDPLVLDWRKAMQQEIEKTLNESFDNFVREAIYAMESGIKTGAYDLDRAKYQGIKREGIDATEDTDEPQENG